MLGKAVLLAAVALSQHVGCHTDALEVDEAPCPDDSELTYDNFGRAFLDSHCQRCHASDAGDRNGAPRGFTFDTREQVLEHRERIFVRAAGDNTSMPPGPDDPPAEERALLAEWLACGAP